MVTRKLGRSAVQLAAHALMLLSALLLRTASAQSPEALNPTTLPCDQVEETLKVALGGLFLLALGTTYQNFDWSDEQPSQAESMARNEAALDPYLPYLEALNNRRIACGLPEIDANVGLEREEGAGMTHGPPAANRPPYAGETLFPRREQGGGLAENIAPETAESPSIGHTVGFPLTSEEKDQFRLAVQRCWDAPAGVRDAQELRVVVGAELAADGAVINASIRLIEPSPAPDGRFQQAYEAGRRALIRCSPYSDLPRDKYAQWRNIEVVFNPEGMVSW